MQHFNYSYIPDVATFKRDSSVSMAIRSQDKILVHIDWLVERYHLNHFDPKRHGKEKRMEMVILCDLFLALNAWIKVYHDSFQGKDSAANARKQRYPAVLALFGAVVKRLCSELGCAQNALGERIDEMFGRDLNKEAVHRDLALGLAAYLSKAALKLSKLHFRGGLAYQYNWWEGKGNWKLVPADSKHAYDPTIGRVMSRPLKNFGPYVCTVEREFFMARHSIGTQQEPGIYHSAYNGGRPLMGAGTMLIENGEVRGIRNDSGHYLPDPLNFAGVLQALDMYGVRLKHVRLFSYKDKNLGDALDFLHSHLDWREFEKQRTEELSRRKDANNMRASLAPSPDPDPVPGPAVNNPAQNSGPSGPYWNNA